MGRKEKTAYVVAVRVRYLSGTRAQKQVILDEMSATLGMHRKSVIRLLRGKAEAARFRPIGRRKVVGADDQRILERLFKACDYPCGKRLVAMLPLWIEHDAARYGDYSDGQKARLLGLSAATLDRHLGPVKRRLGIRGKTGTKPGSLLRQQIPLRSGPWEVTGPGYVEADTVAHCGDSLKGAFAWTLTLTDIHTTWTECRVVWNKAVTGVVDAITDIDRILPFTLRGFDCDNGSEFLNHTLTRYFQEHPEKPTFTRSRPYRKNDNAHVEQKNWTHVRQLFGYQRIDNKDVLEAMNRLYRAELSWLVNLFTPAMKLERKVRIGSKIVKRYGPAKTPFQRLLESEGFQDQKDHYAALAKTLNPIALREHVQHKIHQILAAASVT